MSTTGTTAFNLDVNDLIEEAFERCGKELRSGYDFKTARRSLNLLTIEWANRGINLWTVEQGQIPMVTGQAMYPLPADTIDLMDMVIRTNNGSQSNQIDINISRIAEPTYMSLPNKLAQGRPIQVYVNRQSGTTNAVASTAIVGNINSTDTSITVASVADLPSSGFLVIGTEIISYPNIIGNVLTNVARGQANTTAAAHLTGTTVTKTYPPNISVWPTPNAPGNQYTFVYYRLRRIQDAGTGIREQDIPFRFVPCMVAGLAAQLSMKLPDVDPNRVVMLKADYEQQFQLAADEDRDKAPVRFVPRNLFYS